MSLDPTKKNILVRLYVAPARQVDGGVSADDALTTASCFMLALGPGATMDEFADLLKQQLLAAVDTTMAFSRSKKGGHYARYFGVPGDPE